MLHREGLMLDFSLHCGTAHHDLASVPSYLISAAVLTCMMPGCHPPLSANLFHGRRCLKTAFDRKECRHLDQRIQARNCLSIKDELKSLVLEVITTFFYLDGKCSWKKFRKCGNNRSDRDLWERRVRKKKGRKVPLPALWDLKCVSLKGVRAGSSVGWQILPHSSLSILPVIA